jgi:hypothetical protein
MNDAMQIINLDRHRSAISVSPGGLLAIQIEI